MGLDVVFQYPACLFGKKAVESFQTLVANGAGHDHTGAFTKGHDRILFLSGLLAELTLAPKGGKEMFEKIILDGLAGFLGILPHQIFATFVTDRVLEDDLFSLVDFLDFIDTRRF
jgi:hypothetical protein